jgi:hypothetical protein
MNEDIISELRLKLKKLIEEKPKLQEYQNKIDMMLGYCLTPEDKINVFKELAKDLSDNLQDHTSRLHDELKKLNKGD